MIIKYKSSIISKGIKKVYRYSKDLFIVTQNLFIYAIKNVGKFV